MMICKECGAPIKPGARFCTKCGAEIEKKRIVLTCPECGRQVDASLPFCRFCGCTLHVSNDIPDIPAIPQPEQKEASFFESEVKPAPVKEEKKEVQSSLQGNLPAVISMAAAGIGFLSPVRWIVSLAVAIVVILFRLYNLYPIYRFLLFMQSFMHIVCLLLCIATIGGLIYMISLEKKEDQASTWFGFIPAICSLIAVICTMTSHSGLSFLVSIPAILTGALLANKVFNKRETLCGPFDLNAELDGIKQFFVSNKPKSAPAKTDKPYNNTVSKDFQDRRKEESYFDGNGTDLFIITIINALAILFTCGLMVPWAQVRLSKYEASHTVYDGRRLQFVGTVSDLFVLYLKWAALSMVTSGVYLPFAIVEYTKWNNRHTGYEDTAPGVNGFEGSDFDGNAFEFYGYTSLGGALTGITCGIASGWYFNLIRHWMLGHTTVCHERLAYEKDTWTSTLGILLVNYLLINVTCGIYAPWARCRIHQYAIARTHIDPNYTYHG